MVPDAVANVVDAPQQAGFGPRKVGHDSWLARCPAHKGVDLSLAITRNEFNHVLLECKSPQNCEFVLIIKALGLTNNGVYAETPDWLIANISRVEVRPVPAQPDCDRQARPERDIDREHAPFADLASEGRADSRTAAVPPSLKDLRAEIGPTADIPTDGLSAAPAQEQTLANLERESSVQVLLRLAVCARLFHSEDGRFLVQVPFGDRVEVYGLKPPAFRDWLIAGFQADQDQPPTGSAKSTLAKVLRLLIDPQACPLLALPKSTRDLVATVVNGWLLAYDNISTIPIWLSDSLCQLVFGLGFASRTLFTNDERNVVHARRPVILDGIEDFVTRGDLRDRSVFLHLPRIAPSVRLAESEFWQAFRGDYPRILGGVLDGIVAGLSKLPSVRLAESPRMADYARWGEAFARGVGWGDGTFLTSYSDNR
jgi:hypothetical protein